MNNHLVSVIVPTFNRSNLLKNTIDSVLAQTCSDFELIIVDDGSTDDTKTIVAGIKDERIRYMNIGRVGDIAKVRNRGLQESSGEFVAFCDDDDLWVKDKLERQLAYKEKYSFICSNAEIIDVNGNPSGKLTNKCLGDKEIDIYSLLLGNEVITSSALIRRTLLVKGFREKGSTVSAEDYELWLRVILYNVAFYIGRPLVLFRRHSNTSSFDFDLKYVQLLKEVIVILKEYAKSSDIKLGRYAMRGILNQEKNLIRTLMNNSNYVKASIESIKLIIELLNPFNFRVIFMLIKLRWSSRCNCQDVHF